MNVDAAVAAYVNIRDAKAAMAARHREEMAGLNTDLDAIGAALLANLKKSGETSAKTHAGTAIRMVRTRYWAPDREAFNDFVREHDAFDLFENKIAQGNYKQFMEDNPDVKPPVNADSKYVINVRRGTKNE